MIRAFFAIDIPEEIKNHLGAVISVLKNDYDQPGIRWIKPQNLHITLRFLNEIDQTHIPKLLELVQLELQTIDVFTLQLFSVELFPTPIHPKIISIQVESHPSLLKLSTSIGKCIVATGYPLETHPFRAHLTLGRIQRRTSITIPKIVLHRIENIFIRDIVLYQSDPKPDGSNYTILQRIQLRA